MVACNRQAGTLTTVRLINCALDDAGLDRLLLALARCPNLTCLDLGDNLLTGRGVQALATTALQPASRLLTLNMAGNPVDADGWLGLTAALHANIPLQQLDVSRTGDQKRGLSNASVKSFAKALVVFKCYSSNDRPCVIICLI